jgi:outer membrane protein TolC
MNLTCSFSAAASTVAIVLCAGCAVYAPLPLDDHPHLATKLDALKIAGPATESKDDGVDVSKPLKADSIARLAVMNNPDLVAARAGRGIAEAQVLQAGLLPNPQITGSYGFLRAGPGTVDQWSAGLAEDVRALVTFSATRRAAELGAKQIEADLLWQEWQVIGKARMLTVDYVKQGELRALLGDARRLLADRFARDQRAVEEGNLTLSGIAPDLVALADIDKQVADAELKAQIGARDLDLLLGLDPSVKLNIDPAIDIPKIDTDLVAALAAELPSRRPDLIALKLGYASQDEKYYAAILGQFPALVLGGSGGHDTSAVYTIGPNVTMDLPLFNHNQGNIAIEGATRQKLHAEYTNRLTADSAEIRGLLGDQQLLRHQLTAARDHAAQADRAAKAAESAYAASLIDARAYVDIVTAALSRKQEVVTIEQTMLEQQIALATLTGVAMPSADPIHEIDGSNRP